MKHPVDTQNIVTAEQVTELSSRGTQVVYRAKCPACGGSDITCYGRYDAKPWIKYYRCNNCRVKKTRKQYTFPVECR